MRAICDSCSKPQPLDWRGGDHCVWCGQAVRREVRCFWCANWTPAVKFCRTCGAATVDSKVYGAARMLKDAGCDRFSIPRQLGELDPEQVENFIRIYQEHAAVAAHHVEQVEFLENYLSRKQWSDTLDDALAKDLPWTQADLARMRTAAERVGSSLEGVEKARAIGEASPFHSTQLLALIVRVTLQDWTAMEDVAGLTTSTDEAVRTEAALALSHWRVLYGPGLPSNCRREVIEELRRCPLREAASVRLALLGEPSDAPLPPGDFATALVNGDVDFLSAAAVEPGDSSRQHAAARKLIAFGVLSPVASALRTVTADQQLDLLEQLNRRKKPALELRDTLFDIARDATEPRVHQYACYVLCHGCPPEDALCIARTARRESRVYQALLQTAGLPPQAFEELGAFLLREDTFSMSQYGMNDAAKYGHMPADFVQRYWHEADSATRVEFCKFAEAQLADYGDEALHVFLVGVAFTPGDLKVQSQAWSGLYRWYDSFGYPRRRPLKVSAESIVKFFDSAHQFAPRFARFLEARDILHQSIHRDAIAELLRYPDSSALEGLAASPRETIGLAETLAQVMRESEIDFTLRLACTDFLGFLGSTAETRAPITRLLRSFAATDLDLQSTRALERLANGPAWVG